MGDIVNSVMDIFGAGPASKQAAATESAAAQSAAAAKYATDLQREMWQAQQAQQQPWLQAGQTALNKLVPLATNYTPFGQTDWTQEKDASDPTNPPYLSNTQEFKAYRQQLRVIAINPPVTVESWPVKPEEVWSN